MEQAKLEREVRWLKRYAAASTALFAAVPASAFSNRNRGTARFTATEAERIRVVEPSCASMIPRTIASPSPAPLRSLGRACQKRSNGCCRCSGGIPGPVSVTENFAVSVPGST